MEFEWNLIKRITIYAPRVFPINVTRRPDIRVKFDGLRGRETSPGNPLPPGYSRARKLLL